MDFNEYQKLASKTATFESKPLQYQLMYIALGVAGEAGEVADKIKKIMRNDDGAIDDAKRDDLKKELGDVLWYLSQMARVLEIPFDDVAETNIKKIMDRQARGVIKSTGDNR